MPSLALVTHNLVRGDGQGRVNREIALRAIARGVRLTLFADRVDDDLLAGGAEWVEIHPWPDRPNLAKVSAFVLAANRAVRARNFDAVMANGFVLTTPHALNASHFVHDAWLRTGMRASLDVRSVNAAYQLAYAVANRFGERRAYRAARHVVAVSNLVRAELIRSGVDASKISVIHNGVDTEEFCPGSGDRNALDLPPRVPLALFVGALRNGRKNLDTVLSAMTHVPALHLAVVGDATESPFPALARQLGLADRVRFLGFRSDTAELFRASDFVVAPSRYEPFSLVVLEALACGRRVLTTRTVGASELVLRSGLEVLESPTDVDAMARLMTQWADDRSAIHFESGRQVALQCSWTSMADHYLDLLFPT